MKANVWTTDGDLYEYTGADIWEITEGMFELMDVDMLPVAIFHASQVHHVEFTDRDS